MGCGGSQDEAHKEIEKIERLANKVDKNVRKLLLLGAGSSGKSTLFRQLKCIHGWGFEHLDEYACTHYTRQNLTQSMITLLTRCASLYDKKPDKYSKLKINWDDKQIISLVSKLIPYEDETFQNTDRLNMDEVEQLGKVIEELWSYPQIKECYEYRFSKFAITENISYFFDKATQVFNRNYKPKHEDVLLTRIRTVAVVEREFEISNNRFKLVDIGGQRSERRKWIHHFTDVTALIFMAALNHYNTVLFEDETKNSMHESIELFSECTNNKWFKQTEIIIFFNKDDLFRKRLFEEVSLSVCFTKDYNWNGIQWKSNYNGPYNINNGSNEYFTPKHLRNNEKLIKLITYYPTSNNNNNNKENKQNHNNNNNTSTILTSINEDNTEFTDKELNEIISHKPKEEKRQTLLLQKLQKQKLEQINDDII